MLERSCTGVFATRFPNSFPQDLTAEFRCNDSRAEQGSRLARAAIATADGGFMDGVYGSIHHHPSWQGMQPRCC